MVEVERDGPDSDELLYEAVEQLIEAQEPMPDEAKEEISLQVTSFEEEIRDHWPSGEMPPEDSECREGCDFEGDIYRHIARHVTFGAFVMAAQQVNATMKGYEVKVRQAVQAALKAQADEAVKAVKAEREPTDAVSKKLMN